MRLQLKWTLALFFIVLQFSFAQEKTVSGTVKDDSGIPLPGVAVLVKGTTQGTQTDFDGNYSISVATGKTLVFSFVGMRTVEKKVGSSSTIDVVLEVDSQELEEVVVVGYAQSKKTSFTGTAKKISSEEIEGKSTSNISKALQGESAGVQVINSSGQPGSSAAIRIRGIGSLHGSSAPLYIVDGVPYQNNINSLNQSDIESFTILKDAAATAIYGSRGANGVVVITTKRGKSGHSTIEIDTRLGYNTEILPRYSTISSPEEFVEIAWSGLYQQGVTLKEADPAGYASKELFSKTDKGRKAFFSVYNIWDKPGDQLIDHATGKFNQGINRKYTPGDWREEAFQTALRKETNLKLSGGINKTQYYTSFGYLEDIGYSLNTDFQRYTVRSNINHQVKDWLKGSLNINYARTKTHNMGQSSDINSVFWFVNNIPPLYPVYRRDKDGNKIADPYFGGYQYDYGQNPGRAFALGGNPIGTAKYDLGESLVNEFISDIYFEATFLKDFKASSRFGLQYGNDNSFYRVNPFYGGDIETGGSISKTKQDRLFTTWTKMISYEKTFGSHNVKAFAAHENSNYENNSLSASRQKLVDPFGTDLGNAVKMIRSDSSTDSYALESYLGQLNYEYSDKYYASLTFRRDGSSRFKNNKWGNFGAIGLAWRLSKENFLASSDMVKELKLKASYGILGNQGGAGYYSGYDLYDIKNLNDKISLSFSTKGNPDLTWETSRMFQAGVEFNLWDIVEGSVDYYIKNTEDMFFQRRVGPSLGYAIIDVNDGSMRNSGLEFDIQTHVINTNDLKLDFKINGEVIKNEITSMPIDPSTQKEKLLDIAGSYGRSNGHSIYDFYMREYAGVNPDTGLSQWNLYYDDKNNDGKVQDGERISSMTEYLNENDNVNIKQTTTEKYSDATEKYVDKSVFPDVRGAFQLSAEYKGFSLNLQLLYSLGGYSYDSQYASLMSDRKLGTTNWHTDMRNRWQKPGDVTDIPRLSANLDNNVTDASTRFLTKADYLALNNIKLGYTLREAWTSQIGIKKLSMWIGGDNLWLLTTREGFNPTTSITGSTSNYTYSPLSTITMGVNVQF